MEIHGSSLNISALIRPSSRTGGKFDDELKRNQNVAAAANLGRAGLERVNETPASIEKTLDHAGLSQFTTTFENANQSLDIRNLNAINAYASQSKMPLLEQRAQLLAGIDLYV